MSFLYVNLVETIASDPPLLKVMDDLDPQLATPLGFTDETWGTDPVAVEQGRAMIELAGGAPSPLRDPNKPRPKRRTEEEITADGD